MVSAEPAYSSAAARSLLKHVNVWIYSEDWQGNNNSGGKYIYSVNW